jgi:hypothetical protein
MASLLAGVDRTYLTESELVVLLQARARLLNHFQAELFADMVAVGDAVAQAIGCLDPEFEADEVRAALCLTSATAQNQMTLARNLFRNFPVLWDAMRAGHLDLARVRVILDGVVGLTPDLARQVVDQILPTAPELTTGQLRARLAKLVISVDPEAASTRYQERVKDRRVWAGPNPDGTANLFGLDLPADRVAEAMSRIHDLARQVSDGRTADQVRADVFLDLLNGNAGDSASRGGAVDLRVDLTTLAGLDDKPGEIPGWGPVIADVARQVAESQPNAKWLVTVTGDEGQVVWTGTTRRRPDTALRRYIHASRPTCVFPGCRMPARQSDIDHTKAWSEGGRTDPSNLAPLCRHDHRLKHEAGWKLEKIRPGTWLWTSPLERTYRVGPSPP